MQQRMCMAPKAYTINYLGSSQKMSANPWAREEINFKQINKYKIRALLSAKEVKTG